MYFNDDYYLYIHDLKHALTFFCLFCIYITNEKHNSFYLFIYFYFNNETMLLLMINCGQNLHKI